jgi:hypothetical protein
MKEVSKYFGGTPQAGAAEGSTVPTIALPKPDLPAQPIGVSGAVPKKKKEGC